MASTVVRTMLLKGSWAVRLAPEVWQWVRSMSEPRRAQLGHLHVEVHPDREEEREPAGERVDVEAPRERGAHVLQPVGEREAELEIELNFGISCAVYAMMSATIRIEGPGG